MSSALSALQLASDALQDARKRLERARADVDDDYEIRQAIKLLEDASDYIRKASAEIRQGQE
jgi:Flp pilus assembly protein TadD